MEDFYALAAEDYRQMVAARDWAADLRGHARGDEVRVLDVACGSGKFPAELQRRGLADAVGGLTVGIDLLDPSAFSVAEARSVLEAPFVVRGEHEVRLQDLDAAVGDFDAAWATHALYAIPADQLGAGMNRMAAALRAGGFGAVVHATSASHYLRFAGLFRGSFAPDSTPFCTAEQVIEALRGAGVEPSVAPIEYTVATADRATAEGFLQRCVFEDSVSLDAMEADAAVGDYLAGCRSEDGYRFVQHVNVITWEAA